MKQTTVREAKSSRIDTNAEARATAAALEKDLREGHVTVVSGPFASVPKASFVKSDAGKLRMDLLPPKALEAIADVLTLGAVKYAPNNWIKAPEWSRYYAALQRHLVAWHGGQSIDPETGKSHLAHAACSLVFLMELERLGGPARSVVEATTEADLLDAVRIADEAGDPVLIIAGGSNLVVTDAGAKAAVLAEAGELLARRYYS